MAVRPATTEGWLEFETLTLFPIDLRLVEQHMLTRDQVAWINAYYKLVLEKVGPLLEGEELDWLLGECRSL